MFYYTFLIKSPVKIKACDNRTDVLVSIHGPHITMLQNVHRIEYY